MSARLGSAVLLGACSFSPPTVTSDAPIDMTIGEEQPMLRVSDDLIGLWTFDEIAGSKIAIDTAAAGPPVNLTALDDMDRNPPVFGNGRVTAMGESLLQAPKNNHLPMDCIDMNAVTLEAWVSPSALSQGTTAEPVFIAGLTKSVMDRDVVLLHSTDRWLALVRTGPADGTPDLMSSTPTEMKMTHLVVVADQDERIFYIDNVPQASNAPGSLAAWDPMVTMSVFEEPQKTRNWLGSISLIAIYKRALTQQEVTRNFNLGPDAP